MGIGDIQGRDKGHILNIAEIEGSWEFILDCLFVLIAIIKLIQSLLGWWEGIRSAPRLTYLFEFVPGVINDRLHNGDFIGRHFLPPGFGDVH